MTAPTTNGANPNLVAGSPAITSPNGVVYQLVTITPDLAAHWLGEYNTHNRNMRDRVVEAYANWA